MDSRKLRVLLVGHSPELHGAEYSILRLITELKDQVDYTVLAPPGGPLLRRPSPN